MEKVGVGDQERVFPADGVTEAGMAALMHLKVLLVPGIVKASGLLNSTSFLLSVPGVLDILQQENVTPVPYLKLQHVTNQTNRLVLANILPNPMLTSWKVPVLNVGLCAEPGRSDPRRDNDRLWNAARKIKAWLTELGEYTWPWSPESFTSSLVYFRNAIQWNQKFLAAKFPVDAEALFPEDATGYFDYLCHVQTMKRVRDAAVDMTPLGTWSQLTRNAVILEELVNRIPPQVREYVRPAPFAFVVAFSKMSPDPRFVQWAFQNLDTPLFPVKLLSKTDTSELQSWWSSVLAETGVGHQPIRCIFIRPDPGTNMYLMMGMGMTRTQSAMLELYPAFFTQTAKGDDVSPQLLRFGAEVIVSAGKAESDLSGLDNTSSVAGTWVYSGLNQLAHGTIPTFLTSLLAIHAYLSRRDLTAPLPSLNRQRAEIAVSASRGSQFPIFVQ